MWRYEKKVRLFDVPEREAGVERQAVLGSSNAGCCCSERRASDARGFARVVCDRLLSDELVILGMASYPEPRDAIFYVRTYGAPVKTDASRPELADVLEMN